MPNSRLNLILRNLYQPESYGFFNRAYTGEIERLRHDKIVRCLKGIGLWGQTFLWKGADAGNLSDISGIPVADGGFTRRLLNRKGDYLHANQTTGSMQPLYSATAGVNGQPAIIPDGIDDGMDIDNDIFLRPPLTICAFGKDMASAGASSFRYIIAPGVGITPSPSDLLIGSDFVEKRITTYNGSVIANINPFPYTASGSKLITHVYNGANSRAFCTGEVDTNVTLPATLSGIGTALGLFKWNSFYHCKGWFNHIFLFRSAVTKAQHSALESVLFSL